MSRPRVRKSLVSSFSLGLVLLGQVNSSDQESAEIESDAKKPNVVFIAVDDLRPYIFL